MATVQERLQFKRSQIDTWSIREKLVLASAVVRSGDQNWMSVSRVLKPFAEPGRPPDWFSQKNCAVQYAALLENAEMPKRKKRSSAGDKKDFLDETPGQSIVRMLTQERVEELHRRMEEEKARYLRNKEEIALIESGRADDKLDQWVQEIENEKNQKYIDAENHAGWLKEREEKKAQLERAWKPPLLTSSLKRKVPPSRDHRRNSSQSEQSSEAESAVSSPLNEPLNVDVLTDEGTETKTSIPIPTPTSPLLTSLLKTPSPVTTAPSSSILHNAITSQRDSSPTIASLLSSSPGVPHVGTNQQPSVAKSFVPDTQVQQSVALSSTGAPTLSMLLELPSSVPGKPLPELPSIATTTVTPKTETPSTTTIASQEDLHHPQHQEMRVRKETETDEILEVVELEQQSETEDRSNVIEIGLEEIIANLEAADSVRDDLLQEEIVLMGPTQSDSSTLFDSFLKSMDNAKDKNSAPQQLPGHGQNLPKDVANQILTSKVNTADTKVEPGKDVKALPAGSGKATPLEQNKTMDKGDIKEGVKLDAGALDEDLNLLLESSELQSELIETVGGPTDISAEEFDVQSLAEMEVIIMDKVQELQDQQLKKGELDPAMRSAIMEIVLGSESAASEIADNTSLSEAEAPKADSTSGKKPSKSDASQALDASAEKSAEESKVPDNSDTVVSEGVVKQSDIKTSRDSSKAIDKEVAAVVQTDGKSVNSDENETVVKAVEPQAVSEVKVEPKQEMTAEETKVQEAEKAAPQEEPSSTPVADVEEDKGIASSQESTDDTEEALPEASRTKQETSRAETPLTETSDAEQPVSSVRSFGRHTVTPALDSVPNSPASVLTEDEREYRAWKKAIMLVWGRIASHKYASLFLKPITDDQAPLYSVRVKRPIDLMTIKKSIETGATRSTIEFQHDILLMFFNAQMYNSCLHHVYNMARVMQEDSMLLIRDFVETQKLVQSAGEITALRRETRTTDAMKREDNDGHRTPLSFKRKRVPDLEKATSAKKGKMGT